MGSVCATERRVYADPTAWAGGLDRATQGIPSGLWRRARLRASASSSPLRKMLHDVVLEGKLSIYRRGLPIEPAEFIKAAIEQGEKATIKLDQLLLIRHSSQAIKERERDPEKRWQAHYDLTLAQTVTFQVKAYEYRVLMASIAQAPPRPKHLSTPDHLVISVVNHSEGTASSAKRNSEEICRSRALLKDVIFRHSKTPWAASRKISSARGFSVRLDEESVIQSLQRSQSVPSVEAAS